jgi:hypothetical protein
MRRHERRPAELPVTVRAARSQAEGSIHLQTADVSEGGAFLRSDLLFEVGDALTLEIPLPAGPVVKTAGRVVRVSRSHDPAAVPGMGIEFTGLTAEDRRAIASSIRSASAPPSP